MKHVLFRSLHMSSVQSNLKDWIKMPILSDSLEWSILILIEMLGHSRDWNFLGVFQRNFLVLEMATLHLSWKSNVQLWKTIIVWDRTNVPVYIRWPSHSVAPCKGSRKIALHTHTMPILHQDYVASVAHSPTSQTITFKRKKRR